MNNFPWHPIKSLFQINKYKKQLLIFGSEFFTKSPQKKHSINSPPLPGINPYCILSISNTSRKYTSKTFLYSLKACSNNFILLKEFGLRGSPFPLKIGTKELNIHSSGNLSLNKISLNMFVKDFKHLSPPALNNSVGTLEGPAAFPIFR